MVFKTNKCISVVLAFCLVATLATVAFAADPIDIKGHWAEKTIRDWLNKGYIQGYPNGTFKPNRSITRAEFMTVVNKTFRFTQTSDINFSDVKPADWFAREVAKAKAAGYITGYKDGTIKPNQMISRQEAAVVLAKIEKLDLAANSDKAKTFIDVIPAWSKGAIGAVVDKGYMKGYADNTFQPAKPITRAEAVAALNGTITDTNNNQTLPPASEDSTGGGGGGGGGGAGGGGGGSTPSINDVNTPNASLTGNFTISSSGTYGPSSGSATINGTLTINPGASGTVTLQNLNVTNVIVSSGASNSIHFNDANVTGSLTVDARNQTNSVRLVTEGSTSINQTKIDSKVILESLSGDFGSVSIQSQAANQQIELRGTINRPVTIDQGASGVSLLLASRAVVSSLTLQDSAYIRTGLGAEVAVITINSSVPVTLDGQGTIQTVNVRSNAPGTSLTIPSDATVSVENVTLNSTTTLNGKISQIAEITIENGATVETDDPSNQDAIHQLKADISAVEASKTALGITYAVGDSANSVIGNLTLPTRGTADGTIITWSSDKESVCNNEGIVVRPAQGNGDVTVQLTAIISKGQAVAVKTFTLVVKEGTMRTLRGVVTDDQGNPIAGASVQVWIPGTEGWSKEVTTEANGSYTVDVEPGEVYALQAYKDFYFTGEPVTVNVEDSPINEVNLVLTPAGIMTGVVKDDNGEAVLGAEIRISTNRRDYWTTTDENGTFRINVPAGTYTVTARDILHQTASISNISVTVNQTTSTVNLTVLTLPAGTVIGKVTDEVGNPVSGAWVNIWRNGDGLGTAVNTDANGQYSVKVAAGEDYYIGAYKEFYFSNDSTDLNVGENQISEVNLVLTRTGTITGTVTDENGAPVSGADVRVYINGSDYGAGTDKSGNYRINVPEGSYTITVRDILHQSASLTGVAVAVNKVTAGVNFSLPNLPTGTIKGKVTDDEGRPIAGAWVNVWSTGPEGFGTGINTDAYGQYSIKVAAGEVYDIQAYKDLHFSGEPSQATVEENRTSEVNLVLRQMGTIAGTIIDEDGAPVPGAEVRVHINGNSYGTGTDINGNYSIDSPAGTYTLTARDILHQTASLPDVTVTANKTTEAVNFVMQTIPTGTIAGTVTDDAGNPISKAWIYIWLPSEELGMGVYTDTNGRYSVEAGARDSYYISADKPNYLNGESIQVNVGENQTSEVNFVLNRFGIIKGTVVDENNNPISGATIRVSLNDKFSLTTTDVNGDYSLILPAGTYTLSTRDIAHQTVSISGVMVTVNQTTLNVDFTLPALPTGTISGTVTDDAGSPVARARVNIWTPGDNSWRTSIFTDASGHFSIEAAVGQGYDISAYKESYFNHSRSTVNVEENKTSEVNFVLARVGEISGTVVDEENKPVSGADVRVSTEGFELWTKTDSDGNYFIEVPVGSCSVTAMDIVHQTVTVPGVTVTANQTTVGVNFILKTLPAGTISGTVTDDEGNPIAGAWVSIWRSGPDGAGTALSTDDNGRYSVEVAAGETYYIDANKESYIMTKQGSVIVEENQTTEINLVLSRTGTITGTVVDENGSPILNANIQVLINGQGYGTGTDALGKYSINVPAGNCTVTAAANKYQSVSKADVVVTANQTTNDVNFVLKQGGSYGVVTGFTTIDGDDAIKILLPDGIKKTYLTGSSEIVSGYVYDDDSPNSLRKGQFIYYELNGDAQISKIAILTSSGKMINPLNTTDSAVQLDFAKLIVVDSLNSSAVSGYEVDPQGGTADVQLNYALDSETKYIDISDTASLKVVSAASKGDLVAIYDTDDDNRFLDYVVIVQGDYFPGNAAGAPVISFDEIDSHTITVSGIEGAMAKLYGVDENGNIFPEVDPDGIQLTETITNGWARFSNLGSGRYTVTQTVNGLESSISNMIEVPSDISSDIPLDPSVNTAPEAKTGLAQSALPGDSPIVLTADQLATDADGDVVTLVEDTAQTDMANVATAAIVDGHLEITIVGSGDVTITVDVTDGKAAATIVIPVHVGSPMSEVSGTIYIDGMTAADVADKGYQIRDEYYVDPELSNPAVAAGTSTDFNSLPYSFSWGIYKQGPLYVLVYLDENGNYIYDINEPRTIQFLNLDPGEPLQNLELHLVVDNSQPAPQAA